MLIGLFFLVLTSWAMRPHPPMFGEFSSVTGNFSNQILVLPHQTVVMYSTISLSSTIGCQKLHVFLERKVPSSDQWIFTQVDFVSKSVAFLNESLSYRVRVSNLQPPGSCAGVLNLIFSSEPYFRVLLIRPFEKTKFLTLWKDTRYLIFTPNETVTDVRIYSDRGELVKEWDEVNIAVDYAVATHQNLNDESGKLSIQVSELNDASLVVWVGNIFEPTSSNVQEFEYMLPPQSYLFVPVPSGRNRVRAAFFADLPIQIGCEKCTLDCRKSEFWKTMTTCEGSVKLGDDENVRIMNPSLSKIVQFYSIFLWGSTGDTFHVPFDGSLKEQWLYLPRNIDNTTFVIQETAKVDMTIYYNSGKAINQTTNTTVFEIGKYSEISMVKFVSESELDGYVSLSLFSLPGWMMPYSLSVLGVVGGLFLVIIAIVIVLLGSCCVSCIQKKQQENVGYSPVK